MCLVTLWNHHMCYELVQWQQFKQSEVCDCMVCHLDWQKQYCYVRRLTFSRDYLHSPHASFGADFTVARGHYFRGRKNSYVL